MANECHTCRTILVQHEQPRLRKLRRLFSTISKRLNDTDNFISGSLGKAFRVGFLRLPDSPILYLAVETVKLPFVVIFIAKRLTCPAHVGDNRTELFVVFFEKIAAF